MSVRIIGPYKPMGRLRFRIATTLPVFTVDPTITNADLYSDSVFTANKGVYSPANIAPTYSWKLNGVEVGTGPTIKPGKVGSLTLTVTLTNSRGSVSKTTSPLTIVARPPAFTTQPSISPAGGPMGTVFTGNPGVATNATTITTAWYLNNILINGVTGNTYTGDGIGTLTFKATATNASASVSAVSPGVSVTEAQIPKTAPKFVTAPGLLGTFAEATAVNIPIMATDAENNISTYAITSGAIPGGLTIDPFTGIISGTIAEVIQDTVFTFEVTVTDRTNLSVKGTFTINVANVKTTVTWNTDNSSDLVAPAPGQTVNTSVNATSN